MSKWTYYQLLVIAVFTVLIILNNIFSAQISTFFSFVVRFIQPSILVLFFTVILIIWGFSVILLLQEKKGKPLFVHKVWRIMPAILGVALFLSVVTFLVLGFTVMSDLSMNMHWILDLWVIYFLVLIYVLILSIVLRYGKADTNRGTIMTSANVSVLAIIAVLYFFPGI